MRRILSVLAVLTVASMASAQTTDEYYGVPRTEDLQAQANADAKRAYTNVMVEIQQGGLGVTDEILKRCYQNVRERPTVGTARYCFYVHLALADITAGSRCPVFTRKDARIQLFQNLNAAGVRQRRPDLIPSLYESVVQPDPWAHEPKIPTNCPQR